MADHDTTAICCHMTQLTRARVAAVLPATQSTCPEDESTERHDQIGADRGRTA
jgi:hypothetical protein